MSILQHFGKSEHDFVAKVLNWKQNSIQGSRVQLTYFLSPREIDIVKKVIGNSDDLNYDFFGGSEDSERKRCIIYPNFIAISKSHFKVSCLRIDYNNKFNVLKHSDCLGALMNLGIDRFHYGDIIVNNDHLLLFITDEMVDYVFLNLKKIGNAKISLTLVDKYDIMIEKEKRVKKLIVSSMRIDNILAKAYNISRADAKDFIMQGLVKHNHMDLTNPNTIVKTNDLISLRRFGRFQITNILGKTKKDKTMIEISM